MKTNELQAQQQVQLHTQLWKIANDLRGSMDGNEFKNYILSLIFYRYLSEHLLNFINDELVDDNISYQNAWQDSNFKNELITVLTDEQGIGYLIEPQFLWNEMINEINNGHKGNFDIEMLQKAINQISESTIGKVSQHHFAHLFADMDLSSSKLGKSAKERSILIAKIMIKINEIDFHFADTTIDILGDAYEYLIGQFAAGAGKKAGEFYTPPQVSKLLAKLVTVGKNKLRHVYDPTCGSGALLLRVAKETNVASFYGQELNTTTYNLARMNMLLHKVGFTRFNLYNGNTLEEPSVEHLNLRFDAIVANPPYSASWSAGAKFNDDERFSRYGVLAPQSKADFAFIQHMIYVLAETGTMAVVLPHGVLFRAGSEGIIRRYLIEQNNYLDAVISLPGNLFFGTSIPTCILVFKKCKTTNDILFIDGSKEYEQGKNQNGLTDKNLEKIIETYCQRQTQAKYAAVININSSNEAENTIAKNDYNLNITRYIDTSEQETEIDVQDVLSKIRDLKVETNVLDEAIQGYLKDLVVKKEKNVPTLRFKEFNDPWDLKQIKEIVTIWGGTTPSTKNKKLWLNEIPFITPNFITKNNNSTINNCDRFITNKNYKFSRKNDIFLTCRAPVGIVAINNLEKCWFSQGIKNIRIGQSTNYKYLYYWFCKNKNIIIASSFGTTFLEISSKNLENIQIYITCSLQEQTKIAHFFTIIDKQIQVQKTLIAHYQSLIKIINNQMYYACKMELLTINDIAMPIQNDKIDIVSSMGYLEIGGIDIESGNYVVSKNKNDVLGSKIGYQGNLVISTVRPTRGAIAILKNNHKISSALLQINVSKTYPIEFLRIFLKSERVINDFSNYCTGSTYPTISKEDILNYKIPKITNFTLKLKCDLIMALDRGIKNKLNQLRLLEKQKQYYLTNMFI